jgi:hypothetical protein
VLAANSSASRTQLSAQLNQYTTGQSWLPTNTTEPPVYQIAGLFGRYLHADGEAVLLLDYSDATEELTHGRLSGSSAVTPAHPFSDGYSFFFSFLRGAMAIRKRWNHYQSQH